MTSHELRSTYYLDHSKDTLFNLSQEKHLDALVIEAITNDLLKSLFFDSIRDQVYDDKENMQNTSSAMQNDEMLVQKQFVDRLS